MRKGGRKRGREEEREGGREGGSKEGREGGGKHDECHNHYVCSNDHTNHYDVLNIALDIWDHL